MDRIAMMDCLFSAAGDQFRSRSTWVLYSCSCFDGIRDHESGMGLLLLLPLASLAAATAAAARPNILLFFPDELRYDFGGLHNNPYYPTRAELPIFTPHFDSVALAGVRFTRAFVGAPVCAPSRACLASGRQYDENTVPMNFHNGERAAGRWPLCWLLAAGWLHPAAPCCWLLPAGR
jgi:hypothetical protein